MARARKGPSTTVGAAEFKARCLQMLDRVHEQGAEYVVTKHGRPVARVVPVGAPQKTLRGALADRLRITGDIVSVDWTSEWDAHR